MVRSEFESEIFYSFWTKRWKKSQALSVSFLLFLWKGYNTTPVIRWYACVLLGNLDRNQGNLTRKYFESKSSSKKGINFYRRANVWMSCVYVTLLRDSLCFNCCLLDFTTRKLRGDELKCFVKWTHIQHCKNYFKHSFHFPGIIRVWFKISESNHR